MDIPGTNVSWECYVDFQRAERNQLIHRCAPGSGVCQVHEMQDEVIGLTVQMAINETGSLDTDRDVVASDPTDQVGEEVGMIGQIVARETAVEIGGKKSDTAMGLNFEQDQTGDVSGRLTHPNGFRRINGKRRNKGERDFGIWIETRLEEYTTLFRSALNVAQDQTGDVSGRLTHPNGFPRINGKRRNKGERDFGIWIETQGMQNAAEGQKIGFFEAAQNGMAMGRRVPHPIGWGEGGVSAHDAQVSMLSFNY